MGDQYETTHCAVCGKVLRHVQVDSDRYRATGPEGPTLTPSDSYGILINNQPSLGIDGVVGDTSGDYPILTTSIAQQVMGTDGTIVADNGSNSDGATPREALWGDALTLADIERAREVLMYGRNNIEML